jgi:hypothetical protein
MSRGAWCIFGVVLGCFVMDAASVVRREDDANFNRGLAAAVACAPGTYLQHIDGGMVLCIGGEGETWRVRP